MNDTHVHDDDNTEVFGFYRSLSCLHDLKTEMVSNQTPANSSSEAMSSKGTSQKKKKKKRSSSSASKIDKLLFSELEKFDVDEFLAGEELKQLESNPEVAEKMMIQTAKSLTYCQTISNTIDSILNVIDKPSQTGLKNQSQRNSVKKVTSQAKKSVNNNSGGTSSASVQLNAPFDMKLLSLEEATYRFFNMVRFRALTKGDYVAFQKHQELWILSRSVREWKQPNNSKGAVVSDVSFVHLCFSFCLLTTNCYFFDYFAGEPSQSTSPGHRRV